MAEIQKGRGMESTGQAKEREGKFSSLLSHALPEIFFSLAAQAMHSLV